MSSRVDIAGDFGCAVHAALGGDLLGSILFGSVARRTDHGASDIDILFVVSDQAAESARNVVEGLARTWRDYRLAASADTYSRLRYFADVGDPFVRTILTSGHILRDTGNLVAALAARCRNVEYLPDSKEAARYLHDKALFHHRRVYEQLYAILGDLQLSIMARAQSIALLTRENASIEFYESLSEWQNLEPILDVQGIADGIRDEARALAAAHKAGLATDVFDAFSQRLSAVAEALECGFEWASSSRRSGGPSPSG